MKNNKGCTFSLGGCGKTPILSFSLGWTLSAKQVPGYLGLTSEAFYIRCCTEHLPEAAEALKQTGADLGHVAGQVERMLVGVKDGL